MLILQEEGNTTKEVGEIHHEGGGGHQTLRFGGTFSREKGELLSLEFYPGPPMF